jgi:hypothetical protein
VSVPTSVSFWTEVLLSLTSVAEFSSTVVLLTDFCFVLLLLLLVVSEITSELSVFCSTTIEAPPLRFDGTSEGLAFSTGEFSSLPVGNDSPIKMLCRKCLE